MAATCFIVRDVGVSFAIDDMFRVEFAFDVVCGFEGFVFFGFFLGAGEFAVGFETDEDGVGFGNADVFHVDAFFGEGFDEEAEVLEGEISTRLCRIGK